MRPIFHAIAGTIAMLIIFSFWISTLIAELFLDYVAVAAVKHAIVYGLFVLVPFMAATGGSGFSLGKSRQCLLVEKKKKRMKMIGMNGLLVLIPAAVFLNSKASAAEFDTIFYAVQVLELGIGVAQLTLMSMNFRDGLKLAGRLHPPENK
jgi:hypothetical protein